MKHLIAALVVLVLVAVPVMATERPAVHNMNTTQLLGALGRDCKGNCSTEDMFDTDEAVWYVYGFAQGLMHGSWLAGNQVVCLSRSSSPKQITAVFLKFANERPERWSEDPKVLMFESMATAFSCKVSK